MEHAVLEIMTKIRGAPSSFSPCRMYPTIRYQLPLPYVCDTLATYTRMFVSWACCQVRRATRKQVEAGGTTRVVATDLLFFLLLVYDNAGSCASLVFPQFLLSWSN